MKHRQNIYLTNDVEKAVQAFIAEHFHLIMPFEVHPGYRFRIELSPEQHGKLTDEEKEMLARHEDWDAQMERKAAATDDAQAAEFVKTHYWKSLDTFFYEYRIEYAYVVECRCEYNVEGQISSVDYVFVERRAYAELILMNIDKQRNEEWKGVKK